MRSKKLRVSVIVSFLSIAIIAFSGCASFRKTTPMAFSVPDYVELPAGTLIKDVPFYVNGKDKPPTKMDFITDVDGAFFSGQAQEVLKK